MPSTSYSRRMVSEALEEHYKSQFQETSAGRVNPVEQMVPRASVIACPRIDLATMREDRMVPRETTNLGTYRPSAAVLRDVLSRFEATVDLDARAHSVESFADEPGGSPYADPSVPMESAALSFPVLELTNALGTRGYSSVDEFLARMQTDDWREAVIEATSSAWTTSDGPLLASAPKLLTIRVGSEGSATFEYPRQTPLALVLGPLAEAARSWEHDHPSRSGPPVRQRFAAFLRHPLLVNSASAVVGAGVGFLLAKLSG